MAAQPLAAKTLIYCSGGQPENFAPSVNTTGTFFDANTQIYDTIVQFEREDGRKKSCLWPRNGTSRPTG